MTKTVPINPKTRMGEHTHRRDQTAKLHVVLQPAVIGQHPGLAYTLTTPPAKIVGLTTNIKLVQS